MSWLNLSRARVASIGIIFSFLLLGCSQSGIPFSSTPSPTPSSTPAPGSTPKPLIAATITHVPATITFTPTIAFIPTVTSTVNVVSTSAVVAYPSSISTCERGEFYTAKWTTELKGMLLEAFACPDGTLIAIFHNQNFFDPVTINYDIGERPEIAWEVGVNVDSDKSTGWPRINNYGATGEGMDYVMFIENWITGKKITIPFSQAFQISVWKCDSRGGQFSSSAELYADKTNKLIIIRGKIPGLNSNSQLFFYRKHLTDKNRSYITGILTSTAP
jgi:hypothetical protein